LINSYFSHISNWKGVRILDFIDLFVLPPASGEHLMLFKYILLCLFTIHFSYMGIITGNLFYSLRANIADKKKVNSLQARFSRDIMNIILTDRNLLIVFGIVPSVCISFIYFEILYKAHLLTTLFIPCSTLLCIAGIICLYLYKNTFSLREKNFSLNIIPGFLAMCFLFSYYFVFLEGTGYLLAWKKWALTEEPFDYIFSLNTLIEYFYFITLSFAIAGSSILFFFFDWHGGIKDMDGDYKEFVSGKGVRCTFIFLIIQFILMILYLLTLPEEGRTADVTGPAALIFLITYSICIMLYRIDLKFELPVFLGFILIFFSLGLNDYYTRETAIAEHTEQLISIAQEARAERTGESAEEKVDGGIVFKNQCSSCHHYDMELTGPPLSKVLPKYRDKPEILKEYIKNPQKIDPDYGVMPDPGLDEKELEAVSVYLLTDYWKEKTGEVLLEAFEVPEDEGIDSGNK